MTRQRDWVDYANLTSNVIQNFQLSDLQQKTGVMAVMTEKAAAMAEQTATIASNEQAVMQREADLRQVVFEAGMVLRSLRARSPEQNVSALALTREGLLHFARNRVSAASFRGFEDKERVQEVINGYEALATECAAALSPQLREAAELCAKYRVQQGDLNLLCDLQARQEAAGAEIQRHGKQLEQARASLKTLDHVDQAGNQIEIVGRTGGILIVIGTLVGLWGWGGGMAKDQDQVAMVLGGIAFVIGMLTLAGGGLFFKFKRYQKNLEDWESRKVEVQRLEASTPGECINAKTVRSLQAKFGTMSLLDLRSMRYSRDRLIAKVLSGKIEAVDMETPSASTAQGNAPQPDLFHVPPSPSEVKPYEPQKNSPPTERQVNLDVYVFGPGLPPEGGGFYDLKDMVSLMRHNRILHPSTGSENPDDILEWLIANNYSSIVRFQPNTLVVYAAGLPLRTNPEGMHNVANIFQLDQIDQIIHRAHATAAGREVAVERAFRVG